MTTLKSSNKIKLNDLKIQFLSLRTWIYPLLTFIFLSLGNLYSIKTSYNNIGTDAKNYIFNFGSSYGVDFAIFQSIYEWYPLFILTGILSVFIVFDINFSKKKSTTIIHKPCNSYCRMVYNISFTVSNHGGCYQYCLFWFFCTNDFGTCNIISHFICRNSIWLLCRNSFCKSFNAQIWILYLINFYFNHSFCDYKIYFKRCKHCI